MPTRVSQDTTFDRIALIKNHDEVDIFGGFDIGKSKYHAVAIDRGGKNAVLLVMDLPSTKVPCLPP
ncbi:hypothetical protein [Arthrobacter sp. HLT1-20]